MQPRGLDSVNLDVRHRRRRVRSLVELWFSSSGDGVLLPLWAGQLRVLATDSSIRAGQEVSKS